MCVCVCVCVCNWDVRIYRTKQSRNEGTKKMKGGLLIKRKEGKL